jgi:hypothetical protein
MLDAFTVRCEPADLPGRLHSRFVALADRVAILCHSRPQAADPEAWSAVLTQCAAAR